MARNIQVRRILNILQMGSCGPNFQLHVLDLGCIFEWQLNGLVLDNLSAGLKPTHEHCESQLSFWAMITSGFESQHWLDSGLIFCSLFTQGIITCWVTMNTFTTFCSRIRPNNIRGHCHWRDPIWVWVGPYLQESRPTFSSSYHHFPSPRLKWYRPLDWANEAYRDVDFNSWDWNLNVAGCMRSFPLTNNGGFMWAGLEGSSCLGPNPSDLP